MSEAIPHVGEAMRMANAPASRDHGGDIDRAMAIYGTGDWIDLSTGINRRPWPVGHLPMQVWQALPTAQAQDRLRQVAAAWFGCATDRVLPMAGASAAIQLLPRLLGTGQAAVISPSYNEHAASLTTAGWCVEPVPDSATMAGAELAVIVNPNNPDGREWTVRQIADLAETVGHLIVDESFADPRPDLSVAGLDLPNVTVLRSFGKFWGLAGLRLGFAVSAPDLLTRLDTAAGPWAVSGPALAIGTEAMADLAWAEQTTGWLAEACLRLDRLAARTGWETFGGTHLFRLYQSPDALAARDALARHHIWTRVFPYDARWLRIGIPGSAAEWDRLAAALRP